MNNSPIFITGVPRSGLSMTAKVAELCGVFGGDVDNRCSNKKITKDILDPYFIMLGDIYCQHHLPSFNSLFPIIELRNRVLDLIEEQGYSGGRWYIKDARLILMYSILNEAFPEANWIIAKRKRMEIARSCMRTNYMDAYVDLDGWLNWIDEYKRIIASHQLVNFNIREVYPSFFVNGDYTQINKVFKNIGLKEDEYGKRND